MPFWAFCGWPLPPPPWKLQKLNDGQTILNRHVYIPIASDLFRTIIFGRTCNLCIVIYSEYQLAEIFRNWGMEKCPLPISGSQIGYFRVSEGKFRTDPHCRSYLCLIKENGLAKFGVKRNNSPSRWPPLFPTTCCLASVLICSFLEFVSRRETYFSFFPVSEDSPLVLLKLQLLNTWENGHAQ